MAKDRIIRILGVPFNGDGTTPAEENPAAALRLAGITDFRSSLNLTRNSPLLGAWDEL